MSPFDPQRRKQQLFSVDKEAALNFQSLQVALGQVLHEIDQLEFAGSNIPLDDLLAVALLVFFGIKTIQACLCYTGSIAKKYVTHLPCKPDSPVASGADL